MKLEVHKKSKNFLKTPKLFSNPGAQISLKRHFPSNFFLDTVCRLETRTSHCFVCRSNTLRKIYCLYISFVSSSMRSLVRFSFRFVNGPIRLIQGNISSSETSVCRDLPTVLIFSVHFCFCRFCICIDNKYVLNFNSA